MRGRGARRRDRGAFKMHFAPTRGRQSSGRTAEGAHSKTVKVLKSRVASAMALPDRTRLLRLRNIRVRTKHGREEAVTKPSKSNGA